MILTLRQHLYLVFVEFPLKIQDAFNAFFRMIFRCIGWIVSWAFLLGVGYCVFIPGIWLIEAFLHKPVPWYCQFLATSHITLWFVMKKG